VSRQLELAFASAGLTRAVLKVTPTLLRYMSRSFGACRIVHTKEREWFELVEWIAGPMLQRRYGVPDGDLVELRSLRVGPLVDAMVERAVYDYRRYAPCSGESPVPVLEEREMVDEVPPPGYPCGGDEWRESMRNWNAALDERERVGGQMSLDRVEAMEKHLERMAKASEARAQQARREAARRMAKRTLATLSGDGRR